MAHERVMAGGVHTATVRASECLRGACLIIPHVRTLRSTHQHPTPECTRNIPQNHVMTITRVRRAAHPDLPALLQWCAHLRPRAFYPQVCFPQEDTSLCFGSTCSSGRIEAPADV